MLSREQVLHLLDKYYPEITDVSMDGSVFLKVVDQEFQKDEILKVVEEEHSDFYLVNYSWPWWTTKFGVVVYGSELTRITEEMVDGRPFKEISAQRKYYD